jgi:hypothetical protein
MNASHSNHAFAVEIARFSEHIRGYDLVKDAHLRDARRRRAELLEQYRGASPS